MSAPRPGHGLRLALLAGAAGLALPAFLPGCLAAQDIEPARETAPVGNNPPRIVPDTALVEGLPQRNLVVQKGCGDVRFELGVIEDFDPSDDLEVRWFVNYDDGETFAQRIAFLRGGPDVRNGVRKIAGDRFDLELDRPEVGRSVVVEAWVSDGFDADVTLDPPFRRVLTGKDFDEVTWVIEVQEGVCAL